MTRQNDTRAARRVPLRLAATLTLIDGSRLDAQTVDLSPGGICLGTASQLRLAQLCALTVRSAIDGAPRTLLAMGQIVYSDPDPALGFRTGVQFLKIDADSVAVLGRLLAPAPGD